MKKNQKESKLKKKGKKPESTKFKTLHEEETIGFNILRNHQRATTSDAK